MRFESFILVITHQKQFQRQFNFKLDLLKFSFASFRKYLNLTESFERFETQKKLLELNLEIEIYKLVLWTGKLCIMNQDWKQKYRMEFFSWNEYKRLNSTYKS